MSHNTFYCICMSDIIKSINHEHETQKQYYQEQTILRRRTHIMISIVSLNNKRSWRATLLEKIIRPIPLVKDERKEQNFEKALIDSETSYQLPKATQKKFNIHKVAQIDETTFEIQPQNKKFLKRYITFMVVPTGGNLLIYTSKCYKNWLMRIKQESSYQFIPNRHATLLTMCCRIS